jgi:hypothetical protein
MAELKSFRNGHIQKQRMPQVRSQDRQRSARDHHCTSESEPPGRLSFCRALNIPARYATGYLGDIGVIVEPSPMDFSAWLEVYLEDRWWTFDARHNIRRIGRVLVATGRDATDCAITTSFGRAKLTNFQAISDEVQE